MSASIEAIKPTTSIHTIPERTLLLGLGLTSFAALLLELALTRLFSVVLFYHFAFLAISIALLGLGAGGVFAYVLKPRLARAPTRKLAARICTVNSLAVVVVLEVVLHVPVALNVTWNNFMRLTALYLWAAVPFFLTGVLFSVVFSRETWRVSRLYAADLCGGSMACLAIVPLLNWLGGPNTILTAAVAMAAAGIIWAERGSDRNMAGAIGFGLVALIGANYSNGLIDVVYAKGIFRDKAWVEFARWNALSRVEVDRQGTGKAVVIDADASTSIMNCDLSQWRGSEWERDLMSAPPALANILRPNGQFAIIGPGGGVDVLRAVANGSQSVTGIEINPIIANDVMRRRYADYAYHLYERPDVHIHVTDGRSYLRASEQRFDVVQMTLVDTWASTAAGAFALSENNLYTVQAFREYFDHLKPDGMIAITRWEFRKPREALRVVSVAMQALHELGVTNAADHFIVASQGPLNEDGIPVVVLAKKSSFNANEIARVQDHLRKYNQLSAIYLPLFSSATPDETSAATSSISPRTSSLGGDSQASGNPFGDLIASNDPYRFAASYAYNVTPVSDNAPFFFFTLKPAQILSQSGKQRAIDWKVNLGVLVLLIVLVVSIVAVMAFLIVPLAAKAGQQSIRPLFYFIAVGLGYILVEIAFIQRFVLFLGHPTYALTVVIFLLMLSSGAGSLMSRRWIGRVDAAWMPLVIVIGFTLIEVFFLPAVLAALVGLPFAVRLAISGALLAPLGFVMGMPFPAGLRMLSAGSSGNKPQEDAPDFASARESNASEDNAVEWAWAMNAAASVLGSVLAMVIAIEFGLTVTLACGAAAYLMALLFLPTLIANLRRRYS